MDRAAVPYELLVEQWRSDERRACQTQITLDGKALGQLDEHRAVEHAKAVIAHVQQRPRSRNR
ncbi:hypothetical protein [Streptomyces sp. NPDC048425]|uniref:hypothetical protein n=1 Tax=Streptomyces sp. NPDC048425 TaxID=3365548 RepID=UPI003720AA5A